MHLQIRSGRTTSSSGGIVPRIFYDALLYLQHRCNLAFLSSYVEIITLRFIKYLV